MLLLKQNKILAVPTLVQVYFIRFHFLHSSFPLLWHISFLFSWRLEMVDKLWYVYECVWLHVQLLNMFSLLINNLRRVPRLCALTVCFILECSENADICPFPFFFNKMDIRGDLQSKNAKTESLMTAPPNVNYNWTLKSNAMRANID